VGSVLSKQLFEVIKVPGSTAVLQEAYNAAIEQLTAESWRREYEDNEDEDDEG
jgi:hypothetical protein